MAKKQFKRTRRFIKAHKRIVAVSATALLAVIIFAITQSNTMINPAAYTPLLNTIAKGESNGNYNAYFGHGDNQAIRFTDMTVDQVLAWQAAFVAQGNASSAVGRYQFLDSTLRTLVVEQKLPGSTKFDAATQDHLAIALVERRGAVSFVKGDLSPDDFAHELSKEWAALPATIGAHPDTSYYDGDGLNHARITTGELLGSVEAFRAAAKE